MKTLVANTTTFRRVRALIRHGHAPADIASRLLVGLPALERFCSVHQISLVPADGGGPAPESIRQGSDFDHARRSAVALTVVIDGGTGAALAAEAARRSTTTLKLAAEILAVVAARHPRGDNLFAAVLDY